MVVSVGTATLVLTDLADRLLGHWALAGVSVVGREGIATVYGMAEGETLTIRDREIVAAIAAASDLLPRRAPAARRIPLGPILAVAALVALALAAPGLVRMQAASMVPPERAVEIADEMLIAAVARHGPPCEPREARPAISRLTKAVAPASPPRLRIVPLGRPAAIALPGAAVLVDRTLAARDPDAAVAAARRALGTDPVTDLMRAAGTTGSLRYLLTGRIPDATLQRATEAAIAAAPTAVPAAHPVPLWAGDRAILAAACG